MELNEAYKIIARNVAATRIHSRWTNKVKNELFRMYRQNDYNVTMGELGDRLHKKIPLPDMRDETLDAEVLDMLKGRI